MLTHTLNKEQSDLFRFINEWLAPNEYYVTESDNSLKIVFREDSAYDMANHWLRGMSFGLTFHSLDWLRFQEYNGNIITLVGNNTIKVNLRNP